MLPDNVELEAGLASSSRTESGGVGSGVAAGVASRRTKAERARRAFDQQCSVILA